jgi:uracil-DNA glycosylase
VLLLNTSLTVEEGSAGSHAKRGWETITDALIHAVARDSRPKVFMLWGAHAQAKRILLPADNGHLVLTANHPSPLSAGRPPVPFMGCGHFKKANDWLQSMGQPPVHWNAR